MVVAMAIRRVNWGELSHDSKAIRFAPFFSTRRIITRLNGGYDGGTESNGGFSGCWRARRSKKPFPHENSLFNFRRIHGTVHKSRCKRFVNTLINSAFRKHTLRQVVTETSSVDTVIVLHYKCF